MFTQRDEEDYILPFFNKVIGRFLDIGAYDGETFSTTRALALKKWMGVCVEPSLSILPALEKRYENNPRVIIIPKAITMQTGVIDFYDSGGDMISSISLKHVALWESKNCTFKKVKVETLSPDDLFKQVGYNFNFISLDVEGTNLEILRHFPLPLLTHTKMLCIEFDQQAKEVIQIVKPFGFTLLHSTAENLLLIRK